VRIISNHIRCRKAFYSNVLHTIVATFTTNVGFTIYDLLFANGACRLGASRNRKSKIQPVGAGSAWRGSLFYLCHKISTQLIEESFTLAIKRQELLILFDLGGFLDFYDADGHGR
jgi:hypothetical protein